MRDTEDCLHEAVLDSGMDVSPDFVVVHQPVDDKGALALGGAEHQRVSAEAALVDERVSADALDLAEVFERMAGVERGIADLELLSVA